MTIDEKKGSDSTGKLLLLSQKSQPFPAWFSYIVLAKPPFPIYPSPIPQSLPKKIRLVDSEDRDGEGLTCDAKMVVGLRANWARPLFCPSMGLRILVQGKNEGRIPLVVLYAHVFATQNSFKEKNRGRYTRKITSTETFT